MTREILTLCLDGNTVIEEFHYQAGLTETLEPGCRDAAQEFARLIEQYPAAYISWYEKRLEPYLADVTSWPDLIKHPLEVLHLSCFQRCDLMVEWIGLIDFESPFLLPGPTDRRYVSWLISPAAGIGLSKTFRAMKLATDLTGFANSLFDLGFRGMQEGLCPYSEPRLLAREAPCSVLGSLQRPLSSASLSILIRRAYGRKWLLFWLIGCAFSRRSFPLIQAIKSRRTSPAEPVDEKALECLRANPLTEPREETTVDVVIPTLGRPEHLLKVLKDLTAQSLLPHRVIIVEQDPANEDRLAEIATRNWPFELQHHRVAWVGVCRARNLGLRQVDADWILLMDDDVRFSSELIAHLVQVARAYQVDAVNPALHLPHQSPGEGETRKFPRIWPTFSTCVGLVSRRATASTRSFDLQLEGGWGEDYEFGVRLRLNGANVIFAPGEPVLHLKAEAGGFRQELFQPWLGEAVEPKPSPTVLYSRRKHVSAAMKIGYRNYYWLSRLAATPVYRWLPEIITMTRQWRRAVIWADRLAYQGGAQNEDNRP